MVARVDFNARTPIGRVTISGQVFLVYATGDMVRQLRTVQDSVNAVESGLAASEVLNVPAGSISADNVQDAIDELDDEKAPIASPTLTGIPRAPTASSSTSTTQIATTAFVMGEVANAVTGLLDLKGDTNASTNPNYPAASKGDAYYITVAGKIGGASGKTVAVGDLYVAKADNAGGTEAAVGTSWFVLESNIDLANISITGGTIGLASGSLGYATGNGGTVTQALTKGSAVTLDKPTGEITMNNGALAADTAVTFTFNNSTIAAGDKLILNHVGGGTFMAYSLGAQCYAGGANIGVRNLTAGSLSEAIVLAFTVIKGATS